ncbi:MAG: purine-nucleoside phosphorylase [Candidatus Neomarinimicrobiota bacterium]
MPDKEQKMVDYVRERIGTAPAVAIILGSGLGDFADNLEQKITIPYHAIPGYPRPTVEGHAGELVFGLLGTVPVLAAKGRFHFYEGHALETVTLPVRLFHRLGVRALIITNAAGSVRRDYPPGSLMALTGHLDCTFRQGPEAPDIVSGVPCHDPRLLDCARKAAAETGVELQSGIYCWTLGPAYETPEEIEFFRSLGGDAVGMSTVPELQAAAELGLSTLGISCLTNYAAGITGQPLTHQEVIDTAAAVRDKFTRLIIAVIRNIGGSLSTAG